MKPPVAPTPSIHFNFTSIRRTGGGDGRWSRYRTVLTESPGSFPVPTSIRQFSHTLHLHASPPQFPCLLLLRPRSSLSSSALEIFINERWKLRNWKLTLPLRIFVVFENGGAMEEAKKNDDARIGVIRTRSSLLPTCFALALNLSPQPRRPLPLPSLVRSSG